MTRQTNRRQRAERRQQEGSQEVSSEAGEGQASIYITRDEMEAMANSLRERLLKSQQDMMHTFFKQMRVVGTQNLGPTTTATSAGQGTRVAEPDGGQNAELDGNRQRLGGKPAGSDTGRPLIGAQQVRASANISEPHEEYAPEFPQGHGEQSFADNIGLAEIIRRTMRGGLTNRDLEGVNKSPFTREIRMARNLPDFKLPTVEVYNGKADPTDHLMRYTRHMEVLGASEGVMARCFPLYLTDIAAMWFRQLEEGSIRTWTELVDRFLRQFRVHIKRPKNVMTLTSVKQREDESLRAFLTRFNAAVASVDRPDPSMVLMAAVSRVREDSDFKVSLIRDPPLDLGEFFHEAERFLRQEDACADLKMKEVNATEGGGSSSRGLDKDKGKRKLDDDSGKARKRWKDPKFSTYTRLNETLERIYLETRNHLPYRRQARREPSERERALGRHCLFHDLDGHDTNSCRHLKDIIEEHVRNEQLRQYVGTRNAAVKQEQPPPTSNNDGVRPRNDGRLVIN